MKKKILATFLITLIAISTSFAQNDKSAILKKAAKFTCDSFNKKNIDIETVSKDDVQMQLGFCILNAYQDNTEAIQNIYGDILADDAAMRKFAGDVGKEMANNCTDIILAIGNKYSSQTENDSEVDETSYDEDKTIIGNIYKVTSGQFITVDVKDASGDITTLYWLDSFSGDNIILNALSNKDTKTYSFEYLVLELFDPSSKEYRDYKVLNNVSEVK